VGYGQIWSSATGNMPICCREIRHRSSGCENDQTSVFFNTTYAPKNLTLPSDGGGGGDDLYVLLVNFIYMHNFVLTRKL
jgi:hypothetical protein